MSCLRSSSTDGGASFTGAYCAATNGSVDGLGAPKEPAPPLPLPASIPLLPRIHPR